MAGYWSGKNATVMKDPIVDRVFILCYNTILQGENYVLRTTSN
jgi:hypothetical protein